MSYLYLKLTIGELSPALQLLHCVTCWRHCRLLIGPENKAQSSVPQTEGEGWNKATRQLPSNHFWPVGLSCLGFWCLLWLNSPADVCATPVGDARTRCQNIFKEPLVATCGVFSSSLSVSDSEEPLSVHGSMLSWVNIVFYFGLNLLRTFFTAAVWFQRQHETHHTNYNNNTKAKQ